MNTDLMIKVALVGGGVGIGFGAGYILASKKAEAKWSKISEEEIEDVRNSYMLLRKEGPYADPRTATDEYLERLDELQYRSESGDMDPDTKGTALHIVETSEAVPEVVEGVNEETEEETLEDEIEEFQKTAYGRKEDPEPEELPEVEETEKEVRNVFDNQVPASVYEAQPERDPAQPYPISVEEFMVDEPTFDKIPLIYYAGDGVLADDRESDVPDIEGTIGLENLQHWLENLEGNSTLYIRHEEREADFEISYDPNTYAHVVLGMDEERASQNSKARPYKMRSDG